MIDVLASAHKLPWLLSPSAIIKFADDHACSKH